MAKQETSKDAKWPRENRDTPPVAPAESKDAVPASPESDTPTVDQGTLTAAQKFAAKTKATLKNLSEQENAAYEEAKAQEEAKKTPKVEDETEYIDETDYTKHNALGESLKAKLAAAKAEATQSTPDA